MVEFLRQLVAIPSQAGSDDPAAIVQVASAWLTENEVRHQRLGSARNPRALVINPPTQASDEVLLLNACLDTAPVGDLAQWQYPPFGGVEHEGWLHGRGSADSKAAVAIFSEIARTVALTARKPVNGRLRRTTLVFDNDEHSGRFGGIKAYTAKFGFPAFCAIGYPGPRHVVVGSRGFYRTVLTLRGALGHSGSASVPAELAMAKLQRLLAGLEKVQAQGTPADENFPLRPRASVTWIRTGARAYALTPAKIGCGLDIRLTPGFDREAAGRFLAELLAGIARETGDAHPSSLGPVNCWPAYRTPDEALLPRLLQSCAREALGHAPAFSVSGPSNIGNYLAMHGTQVVSGFGVEYLRIHGPDECVKLDSIPGIHAAYALAAQRFLDGYA
ncbi:M20/M25/M40 family metallo-hydrolase [uncultured Azohydromonas sp.]|jgi:Acetylornithine deacetylase/Succinyl-diaminopimelate desuccinylase and related deacylases|uniref:M20 family metallopeptidase n=1 Tax=uncultured Azohydromonas sp. TaxID=487342 RepID=UPI002634B604|nr:M20/M25/M40 family metallo-hydrolase [uncultured Azohydromonas sp.]